MDIVAMIYGTKWYGIIGHEIAVDRCELES